MDLAPLGRQYAGTTGQVVVDLHWRHGDSCPQRSLHGALPLVHGAAPGASGGHPERRHLRQQKGYHNSREPGTTRPGNYSVVLPPDKLGPSTKAAAYDWTFPTAQSGSYALIDKYSSRLLAAGQANDPRTNGWREFYGQADADTQVEGWDFYYNRAASSDPSHLWHIHLSELRQFTDDLRNKQAMLSVLSGQSLADWLAGGGGIPVGVFSETWNTDGITNVYPDKATNPTIQAETALVNIARDTMNTKADVDQLQMASAAQAAKLDQIIALLEAGGGGGGVSPLHTHPVISGETGPVVGP